MKSTSGPSWFGSFRARRCERFATGCRQVAFRHRRKKRPEKRCIRWAVVEEPAFAVVATVAKSLGKELICDAGLRDELKQRVSFDLKGASLAQLMETAIKSLGLTYRVTNEQLEIVTAAQN